MRLVKMRQYQPKLKHNIELLQSSKNYRTNTSNRHFPIFSNTNMLKNSCKEIGLKATAMSLEITTGTDTSKIV